MASRWLSYILHSTNCKWEGNVDPFHFFLPTLFVLFGELNSLIHILICKLDQTINVLYIISLRISKLKIKSGEYMSYLEKKKKMKKQANSGYITFFDIRI